MVGITWDAANDRTLLLQIIALKGVKLTGEEWEKVANLWNNVIKKDSFRKHFDSIKGEGELFWGGNIGAVDMARMPEGQKQSKGNTAF